MPAIGELSTEEHSVRRRHYMHCPRCNNQVSNNTTVCIHCGAEIGVCIKCKSFSYFVDIDVSQLLEWISASILLGIFFNYSKVKFRKCAMCKNSVQVCINCSKTFKGMNKCPHCSYSHFVGSYSIFEYLKSKVRELQGAR
jgi:predicted amidophosphoribosyltransferase